MLRGRRLLLPQSPLSGWRTTASTTATTTVTTSTTNAAARRTSYSTSQGTPNGLEYEPTASGEQSKIQIKEDGSAKAHGEHLRRDGPYANSATNIQQSRGPASEEHGIVDKYQKQLVPQQQPRERPDSRKELYRRVSGPSEDGNYWTESWVREIGGRLRISISKHDSVNFKLSIARRMGLNVKDSRLASPARVIAALEHRDRLLRSDQISISKARREELEMKAAKPLTLVARPEYAHLRPRWDQSKAESSEPIIPAPKKDLKASQSTTSDPVGAESRDNLGHDEVVSAQSDDSKPESVKEDSDRTDISSQRSKAIAGQLESTPSSLEGERAPAGIRFTIQPTWLPFSKHKPQAESSSEDQRQPGAVADGRSVTSPLPEQQPLTPYQVNQASMMKTSQPKESLETIYGMLFPPETKSFLAFSKSRGRSGRRYRSAARDWSKDEKTSGGIYKKLFPDDAAEDSEPQQQTESQPGETAEDPSSPNEEVLDFPEESIFVSLRNEVRNWIPEEQRRDVTAPEPGEQGSSSTVIILSGLSNSLLSTDFYRILPETKYIEGWAGGLVKVVQARYALSHEPLGRYFLMFHSKPAAEAYKDELLRLHDLSKRLLHNSMGKGPLAHMHIAPQPFLTDDEKAAVRSFTLCPPTAPLQISVRLWNSNLVRELAKNTTIADVVQALRPDVVSPSKVLVTVNTIPGSKAGAGGGLTIEELWLTLRDDGRERGAPWVLSNLREGIMPVKLTSRSVHGKFDFRSEAVQTPLEGPIFDEQDMLAEPEAYAGGGAGSGSGSGSFAFRRVAYDARQDRNATKNDMFGQTLVLAPESAPRPRAKVDPEERFNRFVITFTQPAISRRFVRSWHKRAIWDAQEMRSVLIDAVALM